MRAMLEAIDAVREITASEDINILGTCSGGLTLTALLGQLAARGCESSTAGTWGC